MPNHIIYQTKLIPAGDGLPDVIRVYVQEPLPHISFTRQESDAYVTDETEAQEIAWLINFKTERVFGCE